MEEAFEEAKGAGPGSAALTVISENVARTTQAGHPDHGDPAFAVLGAFLPSVWGIVWGTTKRTNKKGTRNCFQVPDFFLVAGGRFELPTFGL